MRCFAAPPFIYSKRDRVNQRVTERINKSEYELPEAVNLTSNQGSILSATYTIPTAKHDDFFDAYTAALRDALIDLVVENSQLITIINEAFEDALSEYYL